MAFGWAGAAAGAQNATQDAEKLLADLAYKQQLIQEQQAQGARADRRMTMDETQFAANQARLGQQDARVARQDSQAENQRGVRIMAGDLIRQDGGINAKNRGVLTGMLVGEGGQQLPMSMLEDPGDGLAEYEAKKKIDAQYRPPTAAENDQVWVDRGGKVIPIPKGTAQPGDMPHDPVAARQQKTDPKISKYTKDSAERTIKAIDAVLPEVDWNSAGFLGSALSNIGGTDAAGVSAKLATVTSNIAFNALQQLREASKTGGALGAVSERELDLLSSVQGSLRQNQSPAALREQLKLVKESMERVREAAQSEAGGGMMRARDPQGVLHEAPAGTPLPAGWKVEP